MGSSPHQRRNMPGDGKTMKLVPLISLLILLCAGSALLSADEVTISPHAVSADRQGRLEQAVARMENLLDHKRVTNMYYDTPLRDALMDMATQTGVIIVPDVSVQGLVTCELQGVPLRQALDIALASGNFIYRNMGSYILVGSLNPDSPSFLKLSTTRTFLLSYKKPTEAIKALPAPYAKYAAANDVTNAVTITAPDPLLGQLVAAIKKLDRPPRQIMLEARVAVLEVGDLLNLGVQWDWPRIQAGAYHNETTRVPNWPYGIQIGYTPGSEFTYALNMTLNLLEQNQEALILSDSRVMAQHGKEAEIKVTTEEYFEIVTSGYYTSSELEAIEVGTVLKITPEIAEDGSITLTLQTEVSDVVSRGENNLPVVTRRQAMSTVRLTDGGTAVVGGLIDNRSSITRERVPGLGGLPLLGWAFKNLSTQELTRQVVVFVTPRLITGEKKRPVQYPRRAVRIPPVGEEFRALLKESLDRLNRQGGIREVDLAPQ